MRISALLACVVVMALVGRVQAETSTPAVIPIAVFAFELQDSTPAGALGETTSRETSMRKVTTAAREQLQGSGRYSIVDTDAAELDGIKGRPLSDCNGCEAAIAHKLGAQQSMVGIVQRVTQTDYYIVVVIRDASTGKVVDTQSANFAGGEEGWPTGIRVMLKHQVIGR